MTSMLLLIHWLNFLLLFSSYAEDCTYAVRNMYDNVFEFRLKSLMLLGKAMYFKIIPKLPVRLRYRDISNNDN